MSDVTITIVGTGVIGTSLGLALKQHSDPPQLIAHDKVLGNAQAAVKLGAFDKAEWNLINACEKADLIILAMPLNGIRDTLKAIASDLKPNAVISDTCNSKNNVLNWAKTFLPDHVHFVGGHPIVHPSGSGYQHADAALFKNRLYCLTPAATANEDAVQLLSGLVDIIGGSPYFLDAAEHDGLAASVEHLPALLSIGLLHTLSQQPAWRETRKMAGATFKQVSSGAGGDPDALSEALLVNKSALLHLLDSYSAQLDEIRSLLGTEDGHEVLAQYIDQAVVARQNWLTEHEKGDFLDPELRSEKVEVPGFLERMVGFGALRRRISGKDKE